MPTEIINKDKLLANLDFNSTEKEALDTIQHYILNPAHSRRYTHLTYVDEVVLLCLLKDVDVFFNESDVEYYIDGQVVSSSIDKLIEKGYVDSETLKPNYKILERLYIKHPFNTSVIKEDTVENLIYYDVVKNLLRSRNKWFAKNFITTINNSFVPTDLSNLSALKNGQDLRGSYKPDENERISFCTMVNFINLVPRTRVEKLLESLEVEEDVVANQKTIPSKKLSDKKSRFDFNVSRLEQLTSVLLEEIRALVVQGLGYKDKF